MKLTFEKSSVTLFDYLEITVGVIILYGRQIAAIMRQDELEPRIRWIRKQLGYQGKIYTSQLKKDVESFLVKDLEDLARIVKEKHIVEGSLKEGLDFEMCDGSCGEHPGTTHGHLRLSNGKRIMCFISFHQALILMIQAVDDPGVPLQNAAKYLQDVLKSGLPLKSAGEPTI